MVPKCISPVADLAVGALGQPRASAAPGSHWPLRHPDTLFMCLYSMEHEYGQNLSSFSYSK